MSTAFDPYHKWLGIPPKDQPPNHYRLLGIELFESDADVIDSAAEQRMTHVRSFQTGSHAAESQRVLNQIAAARICLHNATARAAYDARLRSMLTTPSAPAPPVETPAPRPLQPQLIVQSHTAGAARRHQKKRTPNSGLENAKFILGGLAGLAVGYVVVCFLQPQVDVFGIAGHSRPSTENAKSATRVPVPPPTKPKSPATVKPPTPVNTPPPKPALPPLAALPVIPEPEAPPAQGKQPPPAEAERLQTAKMLADTIAGKNSSELLEVAANATDSAGRFVLFAAARDSAIAAGNCAEAIVAVGRLTEAFELEPLEERAGALSKLTETCVTAEQNAALGYAALQLCEAAEMDKRPALAGEMAKIMLAAARRSGDGQLVRSATLKVLATQQP